MIWGWARQISAAVRSNGRYQLEIESIVEIPPHERWRERCRDWEIRFQLTPFGSEDFAKVLAVRSQVYGCEAAAMPDTVDEYSEHYLCLWGEKPVSALRVTRRSAGPLDSEEFLVPSLVSRWKDAISSASRFVALPEIQVTTKIAQLIIEAAWRDQLRRGTRLDVINVHERAVRYYGKLGYELVDQSFFLHPKWNTPSHVMLFPATPHRVSSISPVFDGISEPFDLKALRDDIALADWRTFRRAGLSSFGDHK